ncbi:MAG TPA: N-acetyltransferase [Anaerolineales bacterium]|nr:N-acetyltransferase [Anaerolineales bacterium]
MESITLPTDRLLLREYNEADFDSVHAYARDPETVRFMTWGPNTPEQTRAFIREVIAQQQVEPRVNYHLVVTLRESGQIIGGCGIHIRQPEHRSAEIGYCFNRDFWGQGYATETMAGLLRFGFERLKMHRIYARCSPLNIGSERVMQKNGLRKEAHFRQIYWRKGQWRDSLLYAILENEWKP